MDIQRTKTLPELFAASTTKYYKNTACLWRPGFRTLKWTYEELWNHAVLFAETLKKYGANKGDRVVIISQNSPFWVAAFFGCQLRGAVAVPLAPESSQELVEEICQQTSPKIVFRGELAAFQELAGCLVLKLEEFEKPEFSATVGLEVKVSADDLAEIVYTSGTTGFPKGVMLTHKNLLTNLSAVLKVIRTDSNFKFCSILPLFHMFEQTGGLLAPLSVGAQISYAASLNPNHLKRIFQDDSINIMLAVPEFLRQVFMRIKEKAQEKGKLSALERLLKISEYLPFWLRRKLFRKIHSSFGWRVHTFVSGGAPLEKEVEDFWEKLGIYVLQGYGLTETSPVLTVNRYRNRKIESAGLPLENVRIKIAEDGEVLAKGPNVFSGYWPSVAEAKEGKQYSEKTKEAFTESGWFKTGDVGYFDESGHLFLKGRKKDVIVLPTGEKVYPEDAERELSKETDVIDSAVLGIKREEKVIVSAVLLMKEPSEKAAREIINKVNARLLPHQQIKDVSLWPYDDFPRTPTKKVKKYEVLEELKKTSAQKLERPVSSPISKLESIIAQVAGKSPEIINDTQSLVRDLGLDSLSRIELVARIETHLNISVDESEITDKTTVEDVKKIVALRKHKQVEYEFNPKIFSLPARILRAIFQPAILLPLAWLFAPMKRQGLNWAKKTEKPVLFYSNHLSMADGPVIYAALPANIRLKLSAAAATDVLFEKQSVRWKLFRFLLEYFYVILPFARQGQVKSSFESLARALDRGYSVLVFPEGRISPDGSFQEIKKGSALLAKEMAVPVIPVKLDGTRAVMARSFQFPKRAPVSIVFGEPFRIEPNVTDEEALKEIEIKMKNL